MLTASFFNIRHYLSEKISDNHVTPAQLNYAIAINLPSAHQYFFTLLDKKNPKWQKHAKFLAENNAIAAFQLGEFYRDNQDDNAAIMWFKQAYKLKSNNALLAIAKINIKQQRFEQAWQWLSKLEQSTKLSDEALRLKVRLAVRLAKLNYIYQHLAELGNGTENQQLLATLIKYKIIDSTDYQITTQQNNFHPAQCNDVARQSTIQFYATNLHDLARVEALLIKIANHPVSRNFCFSPPLYRAFSMLQCSNNKNEAIQCDEALWRDNNMQTNSKYIAIMVPHGGANTHYGFLYIDSDDSEFVLLHELTHLMGFIDEYPLRKGHFFCNSNKIQKALNLSLIHI